MNIEELRAHVLIAISDIKDHGKFPKENDLYDYKLMLNFYGITDPIEIFLRNFVKDILSFTNANGGIILIGIKEDKLTGKLEEVGLNDDNYNLLQSVDLNLITQKFVKIANVGIGIDLQHFQLGTRKFYYLLIEKQSQILIPTADFTDYKVNKGEIIYRKSGKNEVANISASEFDRFLQIKSNEKSKEFMEIWSKLLPEMFDINPREVLIINPKYNKIYGFNGRDNLLSSSEIEIDKSETGVFNVILQAISAGEIGKISDDEGKPLYKIVGEIKSIAARDFIYITSLVKRVLDKSDYNFSSGQLKTVLKYLGWVSSDTFSVENPEDDVINIEYNQYLWIETLDTNKRVVFSSEAEEPILNIINDATTHTIVFGKGLMKKRTK
jgi:hypothetical protein